MSRSIVVIAVVVGTLAGVSAASAQEEVRTVGESPAPVVVRTGDGFDIGDAIVGAMAWSGVLVLARGISRGRRQPTRRKGVR